MVSRTERLSRLEAPKRADALLARQITNDRAEFDVFTAAARAAGESDDDQERAWVATRQMLVRYPGCAVAFAGMTMTDLMA
ncbi:hypothetical protein [Sphingomonas faeni]|uniref:hypothetical protein n=1 Tax=Sphingomonas faeni TaxID=185950 RepID=UPI0020BD814D|nr:hypothetical protein [Sphingomonas faeni]MCK8457031.1 hypothetical protein [Sphingomonas faeni]